MGPTRWEAHHRIPSSHRSHEVNRVPLHPQDNQPTFLCCDDSGTPCRCSLARSRPCSPRKGPHLPFWAPRGCMAGPSSKPGGGGPSRPLLRASPEPPGFHGLKAGTEQTETQCAPGHGWPGAIPAHRAPSLATLRSGPLMKAQCPMTPHISFPAKPPLAASAAISLGGPWKTPHPGLGFRRCHIPWERPGQNPPWDWWNVTIGPDLPRLTSGISWEFLESYAG